MRKKYPASVKNIVLSSWQINHTHPSKIRQRAEKELKRGDIFAEYREKCPAAMSASN
jgi:hypothetical protein